MIHGLPGFRLQKTWLIKWKPQYGEDLMTLINRPWLDHYDDGVPAKIDIPKDNPD